MPDVRESISELATAGLPATQIASRLGLALPTVDYHLRRLNQWVGRPPRAPHAREPCARVETRERVAELLAAGLQRAEVARRLGISKGTVSYHARRLGETIDTRCARRYDWAAIQAYDDAGNSVRDCQARFGFSRYTWNAAIKRGAVAPRPAALSLEELLVAGTYRSRKNLKARLLREGLKAGVCEDCGLSTWRERPISLALHHINGDRLDNRLSNLRLLCPNCHSQTANFAGRLVRSR